MSGVGEESGVSIIEWPSREPVIKPKRGGSTIFYLNISNGPVSIKLVIDNTPKVAGGIMTGSVKRGRIT
jgi:hypothetical protein